MLKKKKMYFCENFIIIAVILKKKVALHKVVFAIMHLNKKCNLISYADKLSFAYSRD